MKKTQHPLLSLLLYPISLLYGIIVSVRNFLFSIKLIHSTEFNLPIISVGNITVGGTGKTPHVEYLIKLLSSDFQIAVISRGYKRTSNGFVEASEKTPYEQIGDEPKQIKDKFPQITVAVDANRVKGVKKLIEKNKNLQAIILDDAYQHRYIAPGQNILLIDFNHPVDEDYLLPLGRLREPAAQIKRADIIIMTKCPDTIKPIDQRLMEKRFRLFPYQKLFFTQITYGNPLPVFKEFSQTGQILESPTNTTILLLSGIANPSPLIEHVRKSNPNIIQLSFPDHHAYTPLDIHHLIEKFAEITSSYKWILTTEKDAVRLQKFADIDEEIKKLMYFIPIEISFLNNEDKTFNHYIQNFVRNNRPESLLYKRIDKKMPSYAV